MKTAHRYQRPRKAFQCQNLLSGLLMADSRKVAEIVLCDVISMSREVPGA